MKKREFDVLMYLNENEVFDKDDISRTFFIDALEVDIIYENLVNNGMIEDNHLTIHGYELLEQHKIDNAVILAAGMSSRFVPLNYEKPKGLLKVKGEILIERQIRQLHEKGIKEIIVVVGHMKEQFEYLINKYGVKLIPVDDYVEKNNHASVYAARDYLKNTIITSSDLYFEDNIFQSYAYDAYYCTIFIPGKTAERGIETDKDDKIIETMYGDKCYDIWVTLGYAVFSKRFSNNFLKIMEKEFYLPKTANKFWADIQDEHLDELYMYAKRCPDNVIYEFDSLEELRNFDQNYLYNSGSNIMNKICKVLAVKENNIVGIESLKKIKPSYFKFRCKGDTYICDVNPDDTEKETYQGRFFYQVTDLQDGSIKLFKMDKNIRIRGMVQMDVSKELNEIYEITRNFKEYHQNALPLCAAENVISHFANLPLAFGFQERYIMNNTYSFNMDDNFIGCEKLFPYYQKISDACARIFHAKYTDPRPFTGMHCIDMVVKTICKPGDRMMILDKENGGHASVKPVVERLGIEVFSAPYNIEENDINYEAANQLIVEKKIKYILIAPSDLIKPLNVEQFDTENSVLMWDCSQLMGLIAAGLCSNPLKMKKNVIMFGGTHKTFPGPASGLIMTNEKYLHSLMEREINPKYLRNSQMHQKISLLFALLEFEQYGYAYMSHMIHCSNYLGERLLEKGFDVANIHGRISETHQIFIRCSKEEMDLIYDNAYKCGVTLNKKHKELFLGYGIRLGTQEIARYDWNDSSLDKIADIIYQLANPNINIDEVKKCIQTLPNKKVQYSFSEEVVKKFEKLMIIE